MASIFPTLASSIALFQGKTGVSTSIPKSLKIILIKSIAGPFNWPSTGLAYKDSAAVTFMVSME